MAGVEYARIIHGKGSGMLRNAIWARLKSDRRVKSFRPGVFGEGDNGVTVIELRK
jgi:DNA mismatch repair protein MutS2